MRRARVLKQGATYHIYGRANRKEHIFRDDHIKDLFIGVLKEAKIKHQFEIKNLTIMGNHYHMIIKPIKNASLSRIMQWILSVFAIRFNKIYGYVGHVWQGRFKSSIIRNLLHFVKDFIYIMNNPVRAGLVQKATDYQFNGITLIMKGDYSLIERPSHSLLKHIWGKI